MNNYCLKIETLYSGLLGLKVYLDYLLHFIAVSNIFYLQFITNKTLEWEENQNSHNIKITKLAYKFFLSTSTHQVALQCHHLFN
jgi:hypothetical protein